MAQTVDDGTLRFDGGQDSYLTPDRIAENCFAKGVNLSTRKGVLRARDGLHQHVIQYQDVRIRNSLGYVRTVKNLFETCKYQAAKDYVVGGNYYIILVVSGYIFSYNIDTKQLVLLSETIRVNEYARRINTSAAGKYLVIFDFPNYPVIVDGFQVFRANPNNMIGSSRQPQVPISVLGTYNNNRLFVGNAGVEFTAGDPTGNLATPEAPITFTEVLEPAQAFTGQAFSLGTANNGEEISAMGFIQSVDESTGIGSLFVATQSAMYYYQTQLPRTDWETSKFGNTLLYNAGVAGPRAVANVNSDLVFVSGNGQVHALSTARSDAQRWGNVPISREVENYLKIPNNLKSLAIVGYFNNNIFIGANTYRQYALDSNMRYVYDYAHAGMVVLTLDNVATLRVKTTPVWEGLWTGVSPMDFITINNRGFIIAKGTGFINGIYEITPDVRHDVINGLRRNIKSFIYTREYSYQTPTTEKTINSMTIPLYNIKGDLHVDVEFRPANSETFSKFGKFEHYAPYKQCSMPDQFVGYRGHYFKEITFGAPHRTEIDCDPVTNDIAVTARAFQFRLAVTAVDWEIRSIETEATVSPDQHLDNTCDDYNESLIAKQCEPDWTVPDLTSCERYDANN